MEIGHYSLTVSYAFHQSGGFDGGSGAWYILYFKTAPNYVVNLRENWFQTYHTGSRVGAGHNPWARVTNDTGYKFYGTWYPSVRTDENGYFYVVYYYCNHYDTGTARHGTTVSIANINAYIDVSYNENSSSGTINQLSGFYNNQ